MKNNWDLLNTDCKNYIIEWKNILNYFHTGLYVYYDILFGYFYVFVVDVMLVRIIIFDFSYQIKENSKNITIIMAINIPYFLIKDIK